MHHVARRAAEAFGTVLGLGAAGRWINRSKALVLAYHNVIPDGVAAGGEASLHLELKAFREQVDSLRRTHDVVPFTTILNAADGSTRRPMAAITFDDAYRGALELAVPELLSRELPVTIFVAPGTLGEDSFWWDALAGRGSAGVDEALRRYLLEELDGNGAAIREWVRTNDRALGGASEWARPGTAEALAQAARSPLITLGSHGWSHANLRRLQGKRLRSELGRPLVWLREHHPDRAVPFLAYPYGLASLEIAAAAQKAGYRGAVRVTGGLLDPKAFDPFMIPRLNVPAGLSTAAFELRAAGWRSR